MSGGSVQAPELVPQSSCLPTNQRTEWSLNYHGSSSGRCSSAALTHSDRKCMQTHIRTLSSTLNPQSSLIIKNLLELWRLFNCFRMIHSFLFSSGDAQNASRKTKSGEVWSALLLDLRSTSCFPGDLLPKLILPDEFVIWLLQTSGKSWRELLLVNVRQDSRRGTTQWKAMWRCLTVSLVVGYSTKNQSVYSQAKFRRRNLIISTNLMQLLHQWGDPKHDNAIVDD